MRGTVTPRNLKIWPSFCPMVTARFSAGARAEAPNTASGADGTRSCCPTEGGERRGGGPPSARVTRTGGNTMSIVTLVSLLIAGFFWPFVSGLLTKASWPNGVKFLVVIASLALTTAVTMAVKGEFADLSWQTAGFHLTLLYTMSAASFWIVMDRFPTLKTWLYAHFIHD